MKIWRPILSILALVVAIQLEHLWRENESLHTRLIESHRQIEGLGVNLASVSARLEALEQRRASSATPAPGTVSPLAKMVSLPIPTEGSFTQDRGAIVYGQDAKVHLPGGDVVSSPGGVMVSDREQKMIVGDLKLENATSTMEGTKAKIDVDQHKIFFQSPVIWLKRLPEAKKSNE